MCVFLLCSSLSRHPFSFSISYSPSHPPPLSLSSYFLSLFFIQTFSISHCFILVILLVIIDSVKQSLWVFFGKAGITAVTDIISLDWRRYISSEFLQNFYHWIVQELLPILWKINKSVVATLYWCFSNEDSFRPLRHTVCFIKSHRVNTCMFGRKAFHNNYFPFLEDMQDLLHSVMARFSVFYMKRELHVED